MYMGPVGTCRERKYCLYYWTMDTTIIV